MFGLAGLLSVFLFFLWQKLATKVSSSGLVIGYLLWAFLNITATYGLCTTVMATSVWFKSSDFQWLCLKVCEIQLSVICFFFFFAAHPESNLMNMTSKYLHTYSQKLHHVSGENSKKGIEHVLQRICLTPRFHNMGISFFSISEKVLLKSDWTTKLFPLIWVQARRDQSLPYFL